MLPNFWLYTFGHMWNNFDPETWCYFFRKNKQHTAIEDRKKRTLLLLYILTARLLKKKDFDPERSVTNGCFWQTKDDHAYTYILLKFMGAASSDVPKYTPRVCCWCCPPPLFFFWKLLKYVSTIREFLGGHWL